MVATTKDTTCDYRGKTLLDRIASKLEIEAINIVVKKQ